MNLTVMIPSHGELLIKSGQKVDFTTPFIRTAQARRVALPVSSVMKSSPKNIFRVVKKGVGDTIAQGDLLAEHKTFFSTRQYFSDVPGTIVHIDHEQGTVVIEEQTGSDEMLHCFFTGEIEDIDNQKINLKVQHTHPIALASKARHNGGLLYYLNATTSDFTEADIINNYIVTEMIDTMQMAKLETLGAQGVILPKKQHGMEQLNHLILQNEEDYKHIVTHNYPYCLVTPEQDTIIFYS